MMTKMMASVVLGGFLGLLFYVYHVLVLQPKRLRSRLHKQGITGPPPSRFFLGNLSQMLDSFRVTSTNKLGLDDHNWLANVFPFLNDWTEKYGSLFMYSFAHKPILCTSEVDMVRDISMYTAFNLVKPSYLSKASEPLMGKGILTSNGSVWKRQRKIIAPHLYPEKVKDMVRLMAESTVSILSSWASTIESEGGIATITVDKDLKVLTADILSRTFFGSNYSKGAGIFSRIESLAQIASKNAIFNRIGLLRKVPTKANRAMWKLQKQVDALILSIVKERAEATSEGNNILQMILQSAQSDGSYGQSSDVSYQRFVVDNCKNIYMAGSKTSAVVMVWLLYLLAKNPNWQSRARAEVINLCSDGVPCTDSLRRMKIVTMVIQETLRLYPPSMILDRETTTDITFNGVLIPKGFGIHVPLSIVHQNPDIWGPDAHEFNPERFSQGLSHACKVPQVYMPFGVGNRICAGQDFAMTELKIIAALILSKFQFKLSPSYVHSPTRELLLVPRHGLTLTMSMIEPVVGV